MEEWRGEISETEPARSTGLYEEALKSVFHLSSQICGSFIEALSKTGLAKKVDNISYCVFAKTKSYVFINTFALTRSGDANVYSKFGNI